MLFEFFQLIKCFFAIFCLKYGLVKAIFYGMTQCSERQKCHFRASNFKNFLRGACPRTSLVMWDLGFCYSQILSWIRPCESKLLCIKEEASWRPCSMMDNLNHYYRLIVSFVLVFTGFQLKCSTRLVKRYRDNIFSFSLVNMNLWSNCNIGC